MQTGSEILDNVFRLGKNLHTSGAITKGISLSLRAINSELGKKKKTKELNMLQTYTGMVKKE